MPDKYADLVSDFPASIDQITTLVNITTSDAIILRSIQSYMMDGNFAAAQELLNEIPQAERKVLTAPYFNKLRDCILALERFYNSDIKPYLDTKQAEWENVVNQFSYMQTYQPTVQYMKNNYVSYVVNGQQYIFIATSDPPIGTPPTNTQYWRQLTIEGMRGPSGDGGAFLYDWEASFEYNLNDIVVYENKWWVSNNTNQNSPPYQGSPDWRPILELVSRTYPVSVVEPQFQQPGQLWFQVLQ